MFPLYCFYLHVRIDLQNDLILILFTFYNLIWNIFDGSWFTNEVSFSSFWLKTSQQLWGSVGQHLIMHLDRVVQPFLKCLKGFYELFSPFLIPGFCVHLSIMQWLWRNPLLSGDRSKRLTSKQKKSPILPHLSRASLKLFLCTSNWKMVLSQSVEALSLPPCFLRKASKPFSEGYFSLPMNTTGIEQKSQRREEQ